ncbi:MAG: S46 family peptidase [Balneolales bacterium]|nr:S46 family peptidase [Balneolales bacterium]
MNHLRLFGSLLVATTIFVGCVSSAETVRTESLPQTSETVSQSSLPTFDPVPSGIFDNGRMWTFEYAPVDYFRETYDFDPDEAWFERARLGAVRLPNCSGSFISANGLVMTNHHCAREQISQVSLEGENLLDNGFYAAQLEDERKIENYYVDQLIDIQDVTDQILSAIDASSMEPADARRAAVQSLQAELNAQFEDRQDMLVQIVSLYNGGRYSAYTFRRYNDIRMVMAPELVIGYFGGDTDNFTYPRYNLDMTFYRVYVDDKPLDTPYYFPFAKNDLKEGDAVFLIGNPGSTTRQQTVSQLTYRGIYGDYFRARYINRAISGLEAFSDYDPDTAEEMDLRNFIFALKNADKFYGGQVEALRDPFLMGRRVDNENRFREAIAGDPALASDFLPIFDRIAEIQEEKIAWARFNYPGLGISPNSRLSSSVMQRGLLAFLYDYYRQTGMPEAQVDQLSARLVSITDKPAMLDRSLLISRLGLFEDILGADHPVFIDMMDGRNAEQVADEILQESALVSHEGTEAMLASGNIIESDDPMIALVSQFAPNFLEAQQQYQLLTAEESELLSQLGRARFAVYGTSIPPDATFSLRISDGVVARYAYNGTVAPAFTTFYGLYDRYHSHVGEPEWDLPNLWKRPSITLDLSTPINFVSTNDIIGGNSGSPVVNIHLEVVGLAFDSNIEGMGSSDFILDDRSARAVNVDARGMLESLRHVYQAERLVREISTGAHP